MNVLLLKTVFRHVCAALTAGIFLAGAAGGQTVAKRPLAPTRPSNDNAGAVATLRRMVMAYKSLRSLSMTTESEQIISFNRLVNNKQTTTLSYQQQPARLAKRTSDPLQGVVDYIGNGAKMAVYSSSTHIHTVYPTQNNLVSICRAVDAESPQILNPLSFLIEADTLSYLTDAQSRPSEMLGTKSALVVRCQFKPGFLDRLGSRLKLPAGFKAFQSRATLWIDPQTFFLLRSDIRIAWRGTVKKDKHFEEMTPTIEGTERVTQMQVNPVLDQAQFQLRAGDEGVKR